MKTLYEKFRGCIGQPMFQFDETLADGQFVPVLDECVLDFLSDNGLEGWIPAFINGNYTNMGEQVFQNPDYPNMYFGVCSENDDEIEYIQIYEGENNKGKFYLTLCDTID